MPRLEVLPHSTAAPSAWKRGGWTVVLNDDQSQPAPDQLPGWDYDSSLRFESTTTVDIDAIHADCGTSDESTYEFVCLWDCRAVGTRMVAHRQRLPGNGKAVIRSMFEIPPRTIAERIRVERQVILAARHTPPDDSPFAPSLPGSLVLWERDGEVTSVALEGTGGRFPVEAMDFASQGLDDAVWWLSVAYDDPNDAFLASARLYLNSAHPAVSEMLQAPDSSTAKRTLSVIQWDATRRLLIEAAGDERMTAGPFEEGSIGEAIERISLSVLQRKDLEALFALMATDPDRFQRLLQDKLRLLRDD